VNAQASAESAFRSENVSWRHVHGRAGGGKRDAKSRREADQQHHERRVAANAGDERRGLVLERRNPGHPSRHPPAKDVEIGLVADRRTQGSGNEHREGMQAPVGHERRRRDVGDFSLDDRGQRDACIRQQRNAHPAHVRSVISTTTSVP
jgi:hypothetical protein